MPNTNILLIGATGYVGGTLLLQLLEHSHGTLDISALVRSPKKAKKLRDLNLGVEVVEGSPTDLAVLEKVTSRADIIIDLALCDDVEGSTSLLGLLKKKYDASGKKTRVIHFSGGAVLADQAFGKDVPNVVYDDADSEQMANIPDDAFHRNVDLMFLKADEEGYTFSYLVIPGLIYGPQSNVLVEAGIQQDPERSLQLGGIVPALVAFKGEPVTIGGGHNHWAIVENSEVADLTVLLVNKLVSSPSTVPHGKEGYFFAESGEILLKRESEIIARVVNSSSTLPTRTLSSEEAEKHFPSFLQMLFGANCRCRATRARRLGWVTKKSVKDFEVEIERWTKSYIEKANA